MDKKDKIEQKLAEYRARKAREAKMLELKTRAKTFIAKFWTAPPHPPPSPAEEALLPPEVQPGAPPEEAYSVCSDEETLDCCTFMDLLYYLLWFVLWLTLYWIFIKLQFGTVFLIVSAIVFMFVNTRTGPRRPHEVSAYSVFNKNCESINGTLKAEQFEREIRYGPSVVK